MRRLLLLVGLVSCGPSGDPLAIKYVLSETCPTTDCTLFPMTCEAVASIRFVDPDEPSKVFAQQCEPIPNDAEEKTLCALTQITLDPSIRIPTTRVEVQLAIYPRIRPDGTPMPEDENGNPICPATIDFAANGFPPSVFEVEMPALGGRGFIDGYDDEITIVVGCTDAGLLDSMECRNENAVDVTANVVDFETRVLVGESIANNLTVRVGEPELAGGVWVLNSSASRELLRDEDTVPPAWFGENLDLELESRACIQVLEELPGATASLVCRAVDPPVELIDLSGVRVPRATLQQVLAALEETVFPDNGLVLGIVIDDLGSPVANVRVEAEIDPMTYPVVYLSADRTNTNMVGTTSQGIFLSMEAPLDATWSLTNRITGQPIVPSTTPVGGIVAGRLTVMIIQTIGGGS